MVSGTVSVLAEIPCSFFYYICFFSLSNRNKQLFLDLEIVQYAQHIH